MPTSPERGATRARWLAVLGLTLTLGVSAMPIGAWVSPGEGLAAHVGREAVWWGIGAFTLLWVTRVERLGLASIGWRPPGWRSLAWGVIATLLLLVSLVLSYGVILPALHLSVNAAAIARITHVPLWLQTATVLRAGVVEEIVFRGYAIERVHFLTRSKWIALSLPAAAFIAVHLGGWGYPQLIVVAFGTAILTWLYWARRDLAANMLAHFLADFIAFLLTRLQGG